MAEFQTRSTLEPMGDEPQSPERPCADIASEFPEQSREAMADSDRMDGARARSNADYGRQTDPRTELLAAEKRQQGWNHTARPVGAEPNPASTAGTRGASDQCGPSGLPDADGDPD